MYLIQILNTFNFNSAPLSSHASVWKIKIVSYGELKERKKQNQLSYKYVSQYLKRALLFHSKVKPRHRINAQAREKPTHRENGCACWGCCCSGRSYCRCCTDRPSCAPPAALSASAEFRVYWRELNFFWGTWCFGDEQTYWIREKGRDWKLSHRLQQSSTSWQKLEERSAQLPAGGRGPGWSDPSSKVPPWPPPGSCRCHSLQIIFTQHQQGKKQQQRFSLQAPQRNRKDLFCSSSENISTISP